MCNNLTFIVLFLFASFVSHAQDLTDDCNLAVDISDGAWYLGNTTGASRNCAQDMRKDDCFDGTTGCPFPDNQQNPINMCCGIAGIESSIWCKFNSPVAGVAEIDIRNVACDPVASIFGTVTTLQGFILRRVDPPGTCLNPCRDTVKACFDPPDAADANGVMVTNIDANQDYYVEIDTKDTKIFSSCGGGCTVPPTCHPDCGFEIRVRLPNVPLPARASVISSQKDYIHTLIRSGAVDFQEFKVVRESTGLMVAPSFFVGRKDEYIDDFGSFSFYDTDFKNNGLYNYKLLLSEDGVTFYEYETKQVVVGFVKKLDVDIQYNSLDESIHAFYSSDHVRSIHVQDIKGRTLFSQTISNGSHSIQMPIRGVKNQIVAVKLLFDDRIVQKRILITE